MSKPGGRCQQSASCCEQTPSPSCMWPYQARDQGCRVHGKSCSYDHRLPLAVSSPLIPVRTLVSRFRATQCVSPGGKGADLACCGPSRTCIMQGRSVYAARSYASVVIWPRIELCTRSHARSTSIVTREFCVHTDIGGHWGLLRSHFASPFPVARARKELASKLQ